MDGRNNRRSPPEAAETTEPESVDSGHPVALAERVWWVGGRSDGPEPPKHAYLIEQGDQSVLIDPGSRSSFPDTLRRIEEIIPFSRIRWFVCQHTDPEVTSALPSIAERLQRDDGRLVLHWRSRELAAHYGIGLPVWLVDEHRWRLPLRDRTLHFIFTPYTPFPGAFCSFDDGSGVLFSSHLFSAPPADGPLFARDEGWFDAIRQYHEQQMPGRDVLNHALARLENWPVETIAPQQGAIVPSRLIPYMMQKLKDQECGLHLLARDGVEMRRLSRLNQVLREITSTMIVSRDFREIADRLRTVLARMLPVVALEFYVQLEDDTVLHLARESRYRGVAASPPAWVRRLFGTTREAWGGGDDPAPFRFDREGEQGEPCIVMPLFRREETWVYGVVLILLSEPVEPTAEIGEMMQQMSTALQVAVEREAIFRSIELERQKFYERSIRDALTGLFTRFYMEDTLRRLFEIHDRGGGTAAALAMIDIDHFKRINDNHGHLRGDEVLRRVARVIKQDARAGDLPVRLGGEEFGIIVVGEPALEIQAIAERLRRKVASIQFPPPLQELQVTVSIGTAVRQVGESIPAFMERADLALYQAKDQGRNQVRSANAAAPAGQWTLLFE